MRHSRARTLHEGLTAPQQSAVFLLASWAAIHLDPLIRDDMLADCVRDRLF